VLAVSILPLFQRFFYWIYWNCSDSVVVFYEFIFISYSRELHLTKMFYTCRRCNDAHFSSWNYTMKILSVVILFCCINTLRADTLNVSELSRKLKDIEYGTAVDEIQVSMINTF
jgi:hypothetical protein